MAVGPIPWTSIVQWCEFHELDRESTEILTYVIRTLDVERAMRANAETSKRRARGTKGDRER